MNKHSSERARMRRLRSTYRKRIAIWAIVMLIIGIIIGIVLDHVFFNKKDEAEPIIREVIVTPEPAAEPESFGFAEPDMEGFIPDENGPLTVNLKMVEVMGRDISIVSSHDACESPQIRSIVSAESAANVTGSKVRFSLKPRKVFIFGKEDGKRIRFTV